MASGRLSILGLFALSLLGLSLVLFASKPAPLPVEKTRLAVLVVIDQFRGDFLERWCPLFGEGGFQRLTTEGAWFRNCHYPYANTMTGPGHATLATGCPPAVHGIVANDWYERRSGKVYCASLPRYEQVPAAGKARRDGAPSPERLLAPTLSDAIKEATQGRGRVVALSLKDRSAVLPGGRRPDACYWADSDGRFVTSSYYRQRAHPWVTAFNDSKLSDRWRGKTWERLRPDVDYERWSGKDDSPGEGKGTYQGRTFPHPMEGGSKKARVDYYAALATSPFGNDLLLELTRKAIEEEQLGTRETPDLLVVSFSSNDLIGHVWGPDSQEVLDVTLRTDHIIRDLLSVLDEKVGKGKWTLALSADHGICPLPEASRAAGRDARRVDPKPILTAAEEHLERTFPPMNKSRAKARWIEREVSNMLYLNRGVVAARAVEQSAVEKELAKWLSTQPGIAAAFTRTEMLSYSSKDDPLAEHVRQSFHPERSGDVLLVNKPYYLLTSGLTGTTHGSPHSYDTHVPLVVLGPGIKAGVREDAVSPEAAAVILARALGIAPPAGARVAVPEGLFVHTAP
jgi:predicted AlkP superfamily pyrophosphatase or phosphodiesterase